MPDNSMPDNTPTADLNEAARARWDANAQYWDDKIGDGNAFQEMLIEPATERLLGDISGWTVVDIACGSGRFARRMAELGAHVVATDFSERFIECARSRTPDTATVEFRVADATDEAQLLALGTGRFDAAVCSMALMDMATIDPLMGTLPKLLKPGAPFVFSVMHPCFQPADTCKFAELLETDGRTEVRTGVKVSKYITPTVWQGEGIAGQPEYHYYFHRPLNLLFNTAFRHGFVIDGFEEPAFNEEPQDDRYLRWDYLNEIPPVIVVRMRVAQPT